jgi:hypothetical protein
LKKKAIRLVFTGKKAMSIAPERNRFFWVFVCPENCVSYYAWSDRLPCVSQNLIVSSHVDLLMDSALGETILIESRTGFFTVCKKTWQGFILALIWTRGRSLKTRRISTG